MSFASWAIYFAFLEENVNGVDFIILDVKVGSIFHKTKKFPRKKEMLFLSLTIRKMQSGMDLFPAFISTYRSLIARNSS